MSNALLVIFGLTKARAAMPIITGLGLGALEVKASIVIVIVLGLGALEVWTRRR